jgi:16S rRNA processing protein RimM
VAEARILLGVIGRAHGVRGLVRVTSHTADPADLTAYGPLSDAAGRRFVLRWRGDAIAEVAELVNGTSVKVTDRTQAEALTNTRLYIDRAQLPPAEDDEFYLTDLIGLAALGADGVAIGRLAVVHDYGAGVSLEIERDGRPPLIVPFTKAVVPVVDIAGGRVTILPPQEIDAPEPTAPLPSSDLTRGTGPDLAVTTPASPPNRAGRAGQDGVAP